jgi:hypothetical protein
VRGAYFAERGSAPIDRVMTDNHLSNLPTVIAEYG